VQWQHLSLLHAVIRRASESKIMRFGHAVAAFTLTGFGMAQACGGEAVVTKGGSGGNLSAGGAAGSGGKAGSAGQGGASASGGAGGKGGSAGALSVGGGVSVGGASGGAGEAGMNCGSSVIEAEPPIVNVLLVVDKSSSMNLADEFPEGRWDALGTALGAALDEAKERVRFGLEFFPFADDPMDKPDTCQTPGGADVLIPIDDGTSTVPDIVAALASYEPSGGTPTADALAHALEYFTSGDGSSLGGKRYVLLATDGGPNCNASLTCGEDTCTINLENPMATMGCGGSCCNASPDPAGPTNCLDEARTVAQVEALADEGIDTFVVGIPGSQFFSSTLDKLAEAGGQTNPGAPPSYYAVTESDGASGLAAVLTRITTGLITTCRLQLTSTPDSPNYEGLLNVVIDGEEVPQRGDDGWEVDRTTTPPTIVLKGATCEAMETRGAGQVSVTYGCPTIVVPR
jgi:hypothetical protein